MRAFVESRIKPYYLHHPDLAPGTAISDSDRGGPGAGGGLARPRLGPLPAHLRARYPGRPRQSGDCRGGIRAVGEGCFTVRDFRGAEHVYPPAAPT